MKNTSNQFYMEIPLFLSETNCDKAQQQGTKELTAQTADAASIILTVFNCSPFKMFLSMFINKSINKLTYYFRLVTVDICKE
jgi:hypothetical protein